MSVFAFHAAPPDQTWFNDPNGLCFDGARFRLYVQHATDAPDFTEIGWGALSSVDLLDWRWDGAAIPANALGLAYSGSLIGPAHALLTRHNTKFRWQSQHLRSLETGFESRALGPSGPNCRDPFIFRWDGSWMMLVAQPCDWTEWQSGPPSRLDLWRSSDLHHWEPAGGVGPWHPAGIVWEMPVLLDFGNHQLLLISLVDRRGGRTQCAVRYWVGRFSGVGFTPDCDFPADGLPLDIGPDFYAACPNLVEGWPDEKRVLVGWASNWATARSARLAQQVHGGPISLPRRLDLIGKRLHQSPIEAARPRAFWTGSRTSECGAISIVRGCNRLTVEFDQTGVRAQRLGDDPDFAWNAEHRCFLDGRETFSLFVDGPLVELFIEPTGLVLTAMLPDAGSIRVDRRALA